MIICGICGITSENPALYVTLLQNAMLAAGLITLLQLWSIGPVGGQVPVIMGTSSGFLGVMKGVAANPAMGGGVLAYSAIVGAAMVGGACEAVLGFFIKPLRKFFPPVVTGSVVLAIGLSLISVGVNSFAGGSGAKDFGSLPNLLLGLLVLTVIVVLKHFTKGITSTSCILCGIIVGYVVASVMGFVLPHELVDAEGNAFTASWYVNWSRIAEAKWFSVPQILPVKPTFNLHAILSILIMFLVTAVETIGDISGCIEGGMGREATAKELSGGVVCDGVGSVISSLFSSLPTTSFSQNVGLVTMTKVVNRRVVTIVSIAMGLGYGLGATAGALAGLPQPVQLVFGGSGIVPAAVLAIILNIVIPKDQENLDNEARVNGEEA